MFGNGCPHKGRCAEYRRAKGAWRRDFCDSDSGCTKCSHRPMNSGNTELQRTNENYKRNQSDAGLGMFIFIAVIAVYIIGKFFL